MSASPVSRKGQRVIRDKTLVAWVSLVSPEQSNASVIVLENMDGSHEGMVYSEPSHRSSE